MFIFYDSLGSLPNEMMQYLSTLMDLKKSTITFVILLESYY